MNSFAKNAVTALSFIAIGVVVSLAVALPQHAAANPDPGVSYVWGGTTPPGQYCYPWYDPDLPGHHPCWHDENYGNYTAIDYSYPGVEEDGVWLNYTGDFQLFKTVVQTDYCTGVRAKIYLDNYNESNYKGDLHYLHIDPNEFWMNQEVPYQSIYIGDVLDGELDPDCPWGGAHLHQSARITSETPFYANKLGKPTLDNEWEHAIMWTGGTLDSDGDVWINKNELYIGTDPFDHCPDSSSDAAWPLDINSDRVVNVTGGVLKYSGRLNTAVGDEPIYWRRLDLNVDGAITVTGDVMMYSGKLGASCWPP